MKLFTFTMLFGGGMIPNYIWMKQLNLLDTRWVMLLPGAMSVYNMIIMRSFFYGIPDSIREAAEIDGCSPLQTFLQMHRWCLSFTDMVVAHRRM